MAFTPRDQHFAALSFLHFLIALGYVIVTYYLVESTIKSVFRAFVYVFIAILHVGVTMHGCAVATKKWDSLTKEHHSRILYLNLVPIAIEGAFAWFGANFAVFGAAVVLFAFNGLVIGIVSRLLRTGVNPEYVDGHVDPTIYEWMRQLIIDMWNDWVEVSNQDFVGADFIM
uniref:Golgi apparatus membrane protein TVP23 n=1 Tax=Panagrellus redivivus TaxID=6233 RepID=A0A7E4VXE2_PANRE